MIRKFFALAVLSGIIGIAACHKAEPIPVANFTYHSSNDSIVPDTVTFKNLSENSPSCEWTFGDSTSSTVLNPVHIYKHSGTFTILLKAYSNSGKQWSFTDQQLVVK